MSREVNSTQIFPALLFEKIGTIKTNVTTVAFYCPLVKGGVWEIMKCLLCVCVCMRLSHFYINLCIKFIYEDIFTKFAEAVYGCENMSVKHFDI